MVRRCYDRKVCRMVNKRLRAARLRLGLAQLQLAEEVGKKEIEVSRFEASRAQPDSEPKRRIAPLTARKGEGSLAPTTEATRCGASVGSNVLDRLCVTAHHPPQEGARGRGRSRPRFGVAPASARAADPWPWRSHWWPWP